METAEFVAHFKRTFPDLVGGSVLVALSGGRDSVALLHQLREPELGLHLSAAHVHHGLRGAEADADAAFCRRICDVLEVDFALLPLPADDERPATGEAAWRRRRYRALLEHAATQGITAVATAHHRDDVAEGVLVQLLRGAGPRAMAGIQPRRDDGVIRPLLPWSRGEITTFLEEHEIAWREDSSNNETDRLRNRVHLELVPQLDEMTPKFRDHLVNLAGALAEAENFMATELGGRVRFIDPWDPKGGVEVRSLAGLPRALRSRWLHGQMRRLAVDRTTRRQLGLFHLCLDTGSPRSVTMGGRWRLRVARGHLWAEPPTPLEGVGSTLEPHTIAATGIPGWRVRIGVSTEPQADARWWWRPRWKDSVISLRPAGPHDTLEVSRGRTLRARKLLTDKLPRHLRPAWPVFCENDMIHWIPGVWQHPEPGDPNIQVVEVIRQ